MLADADEFAGLLADEFGIDLDALGAGPAGAPLGARRRRSTTRTWRRTVYGAAILASMAFVPPARHLTRAKDLADSRYADPLTVDDLAAAAGLTRAHFSREFRRAFGEPPHAYLLTRRLERAAALLRNTDRSVTDICLLGRAAQPRLVHHAASRARSASRPPPTARPTRRRPSGRWSRAAWCAPTRARNTARLEKSGARTATSLAGVNSHSIQRRRPMMKIANAQLWVHDQEEALAFWTEKVGMEVRADVTLPELGDFRWLAVGPPGQEDVSIVLMAIPGPPVMDEETKGQVETLMAKGFAGTVFLTTDDAQAAYDELKGRGVEFTDPLEQRPYGIDAGFRDPSGNSIRLAQLTMDLWPPPPPNFPDALWRDRTSVRRRRAAVARRRRREADRVAGQPGGAAALARDLDHGLEAEPPARARTPRRRR